MTDKTLEQMREVCLRQPTIDNYVKFKNSYPTEDIGFEFSPNSDLLFFLVYDTWTLSINTPALYSAMSGNEQALDVVCVSIIKQLARYKKNRKQNSRLTVRTGELISPLIVKTLIFELQKSILHYNMNTPESFMFLLYYQLDLNTSSYNKDLSRMRSMRKIVAAAIKLRDNGDKVTYRAISRITGIDHKTISRQFPNSKLTDDDFIERAKFAVKADEERGGDR